MESKRSADGSALVRAAVDHYKPVFEALHQAVDPELQALVTEAASVVGADTLRATIQSLIERSRALTDATLRPEPAATIGGGR